MTIISSGQTKALVFDLEIFPNLTMFVGKRKSNGETITYINHNNSVLQGSLEEVRATVKQSILVGFNSHGYDDRILGALLKGASNEDLYAKSSLAIRERSRPIPLNSGQALGSIDVTHLLKIGQRYPSLKAIGSILHYPVVGDLPLDPDAPVSTDNVATLLSYCQHDVEITDRILEDLRPRYQMRRVLEGEFDIFDAMNKGDSRLGEEVLLNRYGKLANITEEELRAQSFENKKVVEYRYDSPTNLKTAAESSQEVSEIIESLEGHVYRVVPKDLDERGQLKKSHHHLNRVNAELFVGGRYVSIKQGGLHTIDVTTDNSALVKPKAGQRLIELDVASMYPSIILENGIAPRHFNSEKFLTAYRGLVQSRLEAKGKGDDAKADGLKISINAVYGKLASPFSALYDPKAQTEVTNTGQIAIALLMSWVHEAGHQVVTANTDSVTAIVNGDVTAIVDRWETATGLTLEETEFDWILLDNVSDRAMKVKGAGMKYKGKFSLAPSLTKKLNAAIVPKAVVNFVLKGESVSDYINRQDDIREFLTSVNTDKREVKTVGAEKLQKNSRLYHSTNGSPILSVNKDRTDPTESDDKFSTLSVIADVDNLDKSVYIAEARAKVDSIVPWMGTFTENAKDLTDRGLVPMPLQSNGFNFKGQSGRINTKTPKTEDYSIAGALGVYTGVNANNIICLDIDEPGAVPPEVRRHIAESDGLFCWSTNEGDKKVTVDEVKTALVNGEPRGKVKVLYRSGYASNLPGKVRRKSHSGSYGKRRLFAGSLEIFYGEKVNVLGTSVRKGQRRFYTLSENAPGSLPTTLIDIVSEQFEPRAIRERIDYITERTSGKVNSKTLDILVGFLEARGMSVFSTDSDGVKGYCPIHNHAHRSKDEYKVGIRDDNSLWHKCFKEDAGPATTLNEYWQKYLSGHLTPAPLEDVAEAYLGSLREEERKVRELLFSDKQNIVITAPPRTGKTGGVVAAIATKPRDGSLLVYVAQHKKDMAAIETRLDKAGYSLEDVNAQLVDVDNKITKAHSSADVIITHWSYLNAMGHSGEQFGLLRRLRDRSKDGGVVVVIDEFDAYLNKCRDPIVFGGRLLKHSTDTNNQSDKYTQKCPAYLNNGGCNNCELVESSLFVDYDNHFRSNNVAELKNWDNRGRGKSYKESQRVPFSVFDELNLGPIKNDPSIKTQFAQRVNQETPSVPDLDNLGQSGDPMQTPRDVFLDLVGSLDGATVVTKLPVSRETLKPVDPLEIGEGKRYEKDECYFPQDACQVKRVTGINLGGLRALASMGAKVRLLSATYTDETLLNVEMGLEKSGKPTLETVGSQDKQVDQAMLIVTPDKVDPFGSRTKTVDGDKTTISNPYDDILFEHFSEHGILIFANQFKDIDISKRSIEQKMVKSKLYKGGNMQIISPDGDLVGASTHFTKRSRQIDITCLSVKGGYSRGQNWEFSKYAQIPLQATYPGMLYADAEDGKTLLTRRIADAQADTTQALFRVMSIQPGEVPGEVRRVLNIHSIDELFIGEDGLPDIKFIKEVLELITGTYEVYVVNTEQQIKETLLQAANFLQTGDLPEGRIELRDNTTQLLDQLVAWLEDGEAWTSIWSRRRIKKKLQALEWTDAEINLFNHTTRAHFNNGGADKAIEYLRSYSLEAVA